MWHAWRNHALDEFPTMNTRHEGLATRVPFELTNQILWQHLDDFVLVNDDEIDDAIRLLATKGKQVVEGAGAASLAAAIKLKDELRGKKVVGVVTGGNIAPATFASIVSAGSSL
jgi:threonine dehydratase